MFTGMEMTMCPNLAVSAEVMHHVAQVESGSNPFAIGVVGGQLVRQPKTLDEALATVRMLEAAGYNYSLGIAQVNRANLGRYGLDTYTKAFDPCANVAAGAEILAECYGRSGQDWGKAFSCYYSGNFVTGYRDGYVQKVYASIKAESQPAPPARAQAIPLRSASGTQKSESLALTPARDGSAHRVAIRSIALDSAASLLVAGIAQSTSKPAEEARPSPPASDTAPVGPIEAAGATESTIFKPVVRGPGEPVAPAAPVKPPESVTTATTASDQADLRTETQDAAFVF